MQGHLEKEESKKAEKEDTQIHSGTLLYVCALEMKPWVVAQIPYSFSPWHLEPELGISERPLLRSRAWSLGQVLH
jgi:hypothetical protein